MASSRQDDGPVQPFRWNRLDDETEAAPQAPAGPEPTGSAPEQRGSPGLGSGAVRAFRWSELDADAGPEVPPAAAGGEPAEQPLPDAADAGPEAALQAARAEAEQILAAACAEAEALRKAAHSEGLASGRQEGHAALAATAARLEQLVGELAALKDGLYREAHEQTVKLVLAMVEKILGPLAQGDEQAVVRVVERALQLLSDREILTIRVHPDDVKALLEAKPDILEGFDGIQKLTVVEDPSVRPGGCLAQTASAEIDARLDTQLQELVRTLRQP